MANQWYYAQDNHTFGPFSGAQLKEVAAAGTLRRTSIVWQDGMTEGIVAARVNNLFPGTRAQTPPAVAARGGKGLTPLDH